MHQAWFSLDIRKTFCKDRLVKHWKRQLREVGESPSPEVFRGYGLHGEEVRGLYGERIHEDMV